MAKTETPIVASVLDCLAHAGVWCWRQNSGRVKARGGWFYGAPEGTPDIVGVVEGRFFGIEVKTPKGTQEDSQKTWQAKAARHHVFYGVAKTPREALNLLAQWRTAIALGRHQ